MRFIISLFILFVGFHLRLHSQPDSVFHPDKLKELVSCLAHDSMKGRFTGTPEILKVRDFIAEEFKKAGAQPIEGYENYFMPFVANNQGQLMNAFNILGALPGKSKKDETIIFCAHYDHIGTWSTNYPFHKSEFVSENDSVYNGANDNASGVAAIISLLKYYAALNDNERTILFVAFSAEELGKQGSEFMAKIVKPELIQAVINIEMIGHSNYKKQRPFVTGEYLSDFRKSLNANLFRREGARFGKSYFERDTYGTQKLFFRSDNFPFAELGICSHTIMVTSADDKYYHSFNDEASTLDYKRMSEIIRTIAIGCEDMIKGTNTPKRIDKRRIW